MARAMAQATFPKPNQCSACLTAFQPTTQVLLTQGDSVICALHRDLIVPTAIFAEGPWSDIRREQLRRRRAR